VGEAEKTLEQIRLEYVREWADMRGLSFDNDEEAEAAMLAAQEAARKKKLGLVPLPVPLPVPVSPAIPAQQQVQEEPAAPTIPLPVQQDTANPSPTPRSTQTSALSPRSASSRAKSRRASSLFGKTHSRLDENDSDPEDREAASNELRKGLTQVELDALLGFFPDLRQEIADLLLKKRTYKLLISEWKADFFVTHGREATWEERKAGLNQAYDKYHEVCMTHYSFQMANE
jgi:hypothetical protein